MQLKLSYLTNIELNKKVHLVVPNMRAPSLSLTNLKNIASDKHSSLFSSSNSDLQKSNPTLSPGTPVTQNCNAKRRKAEDKMAMIFVAIVTGFLVSAS